MKKVLSLLVAFVFMQTQTWALSGGPFSSSNSNSLVGSYAAVMVGTLPAAGGAPVGGAGIGVFTIGIQEGGVGSGVFAIYSGGIAIGGDTIGLGDPESKIISGIMTGSYTYTEFDDQNTITLGAQFEAEVESSSNKSQVAVNTRMNGTAGVSVFIPLFFSNPITISADFTLVGWKQSADPDLATQTDISNVTGG